MGNTHGILLDGKKFYTLIFTINKEPFLLSFCVYSLWNIKIMCVAGKSEPDFIRFHT